MVERVYVPVLSVGTPAWCSRYCTAVMASGLVVRESTAMISSGQVSFPTLPSGVRPCADWNCFTASAVAGP